MRTRISLVLSVLLLGAALSPAVARAQFGAYNAYMSAQNASRQAISATGMTSVQRSPTRLRMYLQLLAKGKTVDEALSKMKDRRDAAVLQLETLKVDKKSIVLGAPSASNALSAQKRQMEMMIAEQMRSRGKKPSASQAPQMVSLSQLLTAEWPLSADSDDKRMLAAHAIENKIKAADLSGSKEAEKLSPEEEELAEEATRSMGRYGNQEEQPGEPHFVFVAMLSDADREKAMTEAFAKAKAKAAALAKAAGVEMGPLVGLSGEASGQTSYGEEYGGYSGQSGIRQIIARQTGEQQGEKASEAISSDAGELTFQCVVSAMFALGK